MEFSRVSQLADHGEWRTQAFQNAHGVERLVLGGNELARVVIGHLEDRLKVLTLFVKPRPCYFRERRLSNGMLVLLSPAKSLDYDSALPIQTHTQPRLTKESEVLVGQLRKMSASEIGSLMKISEKLSELNADRFMRWESDFTTENSRQALFAFTGDVYQGMELAAWSESDFTEVQKKVRILSGLYGVLRPLDLMQPYRLEMGTKLENTRGKNLYAFWGETITDLLNQDLAESGNELVVNLASNEYFSSVKKKSLQGTLITPSFKDEKNGKFKIISFYAKKARGMMADYIVRNQIEDVDSLKKFDATGYRFDEESSTATELVFLRHEQK